ncbi:uncharacterized protein LTR77_003467 [Saxophila tyrrhenica]|uniref:Uncharacterized protein n=1 Tax=Saxophila tyrrhenica TaxID=1690608 RepID=A0AAV9PDW1_9PEZI|nr:hypothetical protein LTR77_003467 [Saxophila tyrrhenica]
MAATHSEMPQSTPTHKPAQRRPRYYSHCSSLLNSSLTLSRSKTPFTPLALRLSALHLDGKQETPLPPPPLKRSGFQAPRPSLPFNEDVEDDPFMLFPEWQHPFSPLKNDSARYIAEQAAVERSQQLRLKARRGSMTVDNIKRMVLWHHQLACSRTTTTPQAAKRGVADDYYVGSPMDIDTVL